jgi:hypothetical protein
MLAKTVWHLNQQRGVGFVSPARPSQAQRSSVTVLVSQTGFQAFAQAMACFYEELRTFYKDEPGCIGQHTSLVPLPLLMLDLEVDEKLDGKSAHDAWTKWKSDLDAFLKSFSSVTPLDKPNLWFGSVEHLLSDLKLFSAYGSTLLTSCPPLFESPSVEKVRSILLHILWKSIYEPGASTVDQVAVCFKQFCAEAFSAAALSGQQLSCVSRICGARSQVVSQNIQIANLLKRYKYVTFAEVGWIQGCETDVVVACGPANFIGGVHVLWPSLSRAKHLAIAVLTSDSEEYTKSQWNGPWHDWDEEMEKFGKIAASKGNLLL